MAVSKIFIYTFVLSAFISIVASQFDGIGSFGGLGFGLGGKPFGKPGKPFGGLGGLGGFGGKPGKPLSGLGGLVFGDLFRMQPNDDINFPKYHWETIPMYTPEYAEDVVMNQKQYSTQV